MSDVGGSSAGGKFKAFDSQFMGRPLQKSPDQKLRDVSDMYEKHFLREMMKAMRSTVHEGGFIQSNQAEKIFREQLDDHYVDKWGERGGIGLSDMIYKQLVDKFGPMMGMGVDKSGVGKPQGPLPFGKKDNSNVEYRPQPFQHPGKKDSVSYRIDVVRRGNHLNVSDGGNKNQGTIENETGNSEKAQGLSPFGSESVAGTSRSEPVREVRGDSLNSEAVKVPWDGVLIGKKTLVDNQVLVEVEHDNGLKSQLVFKGNLSKLHTDSAVGEKLQAGDTLGFLGANAKSVYWTVQKRSDLGHESRPETVSE